MERSRLKNIIILILALLNLFLLLSLGLRLSAAHTAKASLQQELRSRFLSEGVTLPEQIPSDPVPAACQTERDPEEEASMAAFALGSGSTLSETGSIRLYTTPQGQASFRSGGSFEISLPLPDGDPEDWMRSFCKAFGYQDLRTTASGAQALQYCDGYPVANAAVRFTVQENGLRVHGIHLSSDRSSQGEPGKLDAPTALMRFLEFRRESGAVISSVSRIQPAYLLESTSLSPMSLLPIWRITADNREYCVSALTGTVEQNSYLP